MIKRKITLTQQDLFLQKLAPLQNYFSDYSFPGLYLYRKIHDFYLWEAEEWFVFGKTFDQSAYLMPLFKLNFNHVPLFKSLLTKDLVLFPVAEKDLVFFDSPAFKITYHNADSDYLYYTDKIKTYAGRALQQKRNFVHQYKKNYCHNFKPLTLDNAMEAFQILNQWQESSAQARHLTDYSECSECLNLLGTLNVTGQIHYTDQKPSGFIIGEALNNNVFDIHFAKADKNIKGLYPFMYQTLALSLAATHTYLNFEQDLDNPALRKAKRSFCPDLILKKYRVALA